MFKRNEILFSLISTVNWDVPACSGPFQAIDMERRLKFKLSAESISLFS
jgi:hypothetical protein